MKTCPQCGGAMPEHAPDGRCANCAEQPPVIGESLEPVKQWRRAANSVKRHPVITGLAVGLVLFATVAMLGWLLSRQKTPTMASLPVGDGERAAAGRQDGHAGTGEGLPANTHGPWRIEAPEPTKSVAHKREIRVMDFSSDGRLLATSGEDRTIKVWNGNGTNLVWEVPNAAGESFSDTDVTGLRFTPDGKCLMTCSAGGSIKLWNVHTGERVRDYGTPAYDLEHFPDHRRSFIAGIHGVFMVLDTATGEIIAELDAARRELSPGSRFWWAAAAMSSDGKTIAGSISDDWGKAEITIWNGTNYTAITNFVAHPSRVYSIAFSPRGDLLATGGSKDSSVRLWDWNSPSEPAQQPLIARANATLRPRHVLRDHKHHVREVLFSPDGMLLASVSEFLGKGQLIIWAMKDLTQPMFEWSGAGLYSIAFSPDGKSIATGDYRGNVRTWRLTRSRPKSPEAP